MRSASSKTLYLLVSAGALAALAWSAQQGGGPAVVRAAAPPIRAVDEPPSTQLRGELTVDFGLGRGYVTGMDVLCVPSPCSAADLAKAKSELAARRDATRPARGSAPRVVAELPGHGSLLEWRNGSNRMCLTAARGPHGAGPIFGPCVEPCDDLCLRSNGAGTSLRSIQYLLAGTVRRDATALRVTRSHGGPVEYALRGPLVPGTDRRVFMLWLARSDWRRLELRRGGSSIAEQTMPAAQAAAEDCEERVSTQAQLIRCLRLIPGARFP